jgi:hypothetical protein
MHAERLPTIEPGQIWLIEHDPAAPISGIDRDALCQANVVLYDRALATLVAESLPLGGYAEPLSAADPAISQRALALAGQGWSVVQIVAARPSHRARLHPASNRADGTLPRAPAPACAFTANGLAG